MTPSTPPPAARDRDPVKSLWSFGNLLRDDGVSALEYIEQLTYLICVKIAHEQRHRILNPQRLPGSQAWDQLRATSPYEQGSFYEKILWDFGNRPDAIGRIFRKAQNRVSDPLKLSRLIDLVDQHYWTGVPGLPPGAVFEALLGRVADDAKTGAGQYYTPRPLIDAVVRCVRPTVDDTIIDPACGTGGFLITAFDYLIEHFPRGADRARRAQTDEDIVSGNELVETTARLAMANLFLHGVAQPRVVVGDALLSRPERHATLVLTAPPFGRGSVIADYGYSRYDLWAATANKQLNFLQHVFTLLDIGGRAAVVVTDNVLFEGGAGAEIRKRLLHHCDVHTLLRLPTGVFSAKGVRANVLFFDKPAPRTDGRPSTRRLWVYDMRSRQPSVTKTAPLAETDYLDFVAAYRPGRSREERDETSWFRPFDVDELLSRDGCELDLRVAPRQTEPATEPDVDLYRIAEDITGELRSALAEFTALADALRVLGRPSGQSGQDPTR
ncbi:type I restriction enzyme M protein [Catenulispora sp. GP43]|uniref:class I SAM-dependent DNA methyltransferase n=1 Tax=Catenulispora sp. GP43 TaxID=3156263 RepID=UPI003517EA64